MYNPVKFIIYNSRNLYGPLETQLYLNMNLIYNSRNLYGPLEIDSDIGIPYIYNSRNLYGPLEKLKIEIKTKSTIVEIYMVL